jgi:hypothetical protein
MDENGKAVYPEMNFQYCVFQSWLDKGFCWIYLDGSQSRRTLNIPSFLQMAQDKFPSLLHDIYEATRTTSFYLLNLVDMTVTHLTPQGNSEIPYLDSVRNLVENKKTGKRTKRLIGEKMPIEEVLLQYGFNAPSKSSIQNLQVSLTKNDPTRAGFLSRFLDRKKY